MSPLLKHTHTHTMLEGSSIRGKLFSVSPWTEIDELTRGWEGSELQAGLRLDVQSVE